MPIREEREMLVKTEGGTDPRYGCTPEDRPIQLHLKYGVINLDKPPGPTSHQVVAWIKSVLHIDRAGHGGTLGVVEEIPSRRACFRWR
jgi:H/ACA ribonucleoprotein complex subunit 4